VFLTLQLLETLFHIINFYKTGVTRPVSGPHRNRTTGALRNTRHDQMQAAMDRKAAGQGRTRTAPQVPRRETAQYTPEPGTGSYGHQGHWTEAHKNRAAGASRGTSGNPPQPNTGGYGHQGRRAGPHKNRATSASQATSAIHAVAQIQAAMDIRDTGQGRTRTPADASRAASAIHATTGYGPRGRRQGHTRTTPQASRRGNSAIHRSRVQATMDRKNAG
jgi:hypothetical protein